MLDTFPDNMDSPYLCLLFPVTAGVQGLGLGSDEEEIVLLVYILVDPETNKVVNIHEYLVKPRTADINENILSEQCIAETTLTEDIIKAAPPIEIALDEFESYVRSHLLSGVRPRGIEFVTDGQLPLRQCLHPEACSKNIQLAEFYETFYDLRKEFCQFYHATELHSIREMVQYLEMLPNPELEQFEFHAKEVKDMLSLVIRLLADGHKFENPEIISLRLEPGICSKNEEVDGNCVVRARGLPWQSSDQDIAKFFRGLNVAKGGVALCLSPQGRRNGEALVRFVNQEHRDMALKRHKHHIGNRYIEVYKASGEDFVNVAGGNNNEAQAFLSRGGQVIVRMRGLPYDCTAKQVLDFFAAGDTSCSVLDGEEGVLFVKKPDGRATGDAFVLFSEEDDAALALSKHRELIGSRYIELFRSTTAEVQQVLNRSMDPKTYEQQAPLIAQLPQVPLLPQHIITSGTRKDCIRLRGLLYEAQVEHILEFLGEHAKNIVFQGVHMVYNAQGQPSGEAFIQMDSEQSAFLAAQQKHHRYMIFGKKQRYIEVFQCSGEDMNLVLTGGIPAQKAAAAAAALMSPGMLATSPGGHQPPAPPPQTTWEHPLMLQNLAALRMQAPPPSPADPLWFLGAQHKLSIPPPQSWTDLNGNSAHPPVSAPSSTPTKPSYPPAQTTYAPLLQPASPYPMHQSPHLPPPPLFLLNPRMASFVAAAAAARQQQVAQLQQHVAAQAQKAGSQGNPMAMLPPGAAAAAMHQLGLKRSWEQAFPGTSQAAVALSAAQQGVKRPWQTQGPNPYPTATPQTPSALPVMYQQPSQFYPSM